MSIDMHIKHKDSHFPKIKIQSTLTQANYKNNHKIFVHMRKPDKILILPT